VNLNTAAEKGNLKMTKWLMKNGCEMGGSATHCAALGGHLEILHWLQDKGWV